MNFLNTLNIHSVISYLKIFSKNIHGHYFFQKIFNHTKKAHLLGENFKKSSTVQDKGFN